VASKENIGCAFIAAGSVMTDGISGSASAQVPAGSSSCVRICSGTPDLVALRSNLIAHAITGVMLVQDCRFFREKGKGRRLDSGMLTA